MLTQDCIAKIKDTQLSTIIGRYVKLFKAGNEYQACCPFHNEKTPSFKINDRKGFYKCFGCGESGGVINFVMKQDRLPFYEACKQIAEWEGIQLEFENPPSEEDKKAWEEKKSAAELQEQVLNFVVPIYRKQLADLPEEHPAKKWLRDRHITDDLIDTWNIGWGGEEWNTVTSQLIAKNLWEPANKLGISKHNEDRTSNYDGYKNRITFPICDKHGRLIGMGGRYISTSPNDPSKAPKYINPAECDLYSKSTVLYGLDQAAAAIKEKGLVYITEGYMDVVSPHRINLKNTVATCGTAFTQEQMKLLKRYTSHIVMMRDNDDAGEKSFAKALPELLRAGFRVEKARYTGKDPDAWVNSLTIEEGKPTELPGHQDGVIAYAEMLLHDNNEIHSRAAAKSEILKVLSQIGNDILRNNYLDNLCKSYKWKAADTKKELAALLQSVPEDEDTSFTEDGEAIRFPEWMKDEMKEHFMMAGYVAVKRKHKGKPLVGYYTFSSNGKTQITNFIVNPLFRIEAGQESRYLSEIDNGFRQAVVDMPAKVFPSVEQFQNMCVAAGGSFLIHGTRNHWLRIAEDLLHKYHVCLEVQALGWQDHGFFAWVDKAFIPGAGMKEYNKWGILEHKDKNFLVPASSEAYKQLQVFGSDPYENQRTLCIRQSPVTFEQWGEQMVKVYKSKGTVAIAYVVLTLFRDIIFGVDNNCPHLYGFGEPSSGKSKWAESITALFYYRRAAFNLNSGTDFSFFLYMSMFTNCPAHLNEFEIEVIKPEWFQAIKGAFDGEGRVRGKLGSKNSTEIQKIVSTLVLTGQKLITADDNSVVTRCIIEAFSTEQYTEEQSKEYTTLKNWEAAGMSSALLPVLELRKWFEEGYKDRLNAQLSYWRKHKTSNIQLNQRIMQNFAHLCTCYAMLSEKMRMPVTAGDFTEYCWEQAKRWSQFIRSSDTLSEFWRTLEYLANQGVVLEGWDYKVEMVTEVTVSRNRNENMIHSFEHPTKVLYLRINNAHKLFQKEYKQRTNKEAMSLENLLHYFSSRRYYVGAVKNKRFTRFISVTDEQNRQNSREIITEKQKEEKVTSCYAFVYDDLEIDICRQDPLEVEHKDREEETGKSDMTNVQEPPADEMPF